VYFAKARDRLVDDDRCSRDRLRSARTLYPREERDLV
jgi:hypothetical protein